MTNKTTKYSAYSIYIICSVWFFWGFVAASNGIFIPFCKSHFQLSQFQAQLIDFSFYGAYFIGSLLLWIFSQISGIDLLSKIGYKNAIIYGLMISIAGAVAIIPAVNVGVFGLILSAFFLIALGFSLQQVASQPYIIALGPPQSGNHRITLAGAVNSIGTLLGPLAVSIWLFGTVNADAAAASLSSINSLYLILAIAFGLAVALLYFSNLPVITNDQKIERGFGALAFPQLRWAMVGIFIYVGVEVTIQSNMGELLKQSAFGGYNTAQISSFISLYWGSLMVGRITGALHAFQLTKKIKTILIFVVPFISFAVILGFNYLKGNEIEGFYAYLICIAFLALGMFFAENKPFKTLLIFSIWGVLSMLVGILTDGQIALYAFLSGGLCCSIMWPCIFSAGLAGLGKYANQGSTFMIMMILGGAILPPLQGLLADNIGIHLSYIVPLLGFCYLAVFAIEVKKLLKSKGLDYDTMQE
jgi:MFS transporter, FHS family, L-fucose permease